MGKSAAKDKRVLVGVLKSKNDLKVLVEEGWYRIPHIYAPKKKFSYIAFYQPAIFGKNGKRIQYYARIRKRKLVKRIEVVREPHHPRAHERYIKYAFSAVEELPKPIKNIIPRRVSFGFTTLRTLLASRDLLELYGIPKTEQIVEKRLQELGIKSKAELPITIRGKRFRIDLAIFCAQGNIAIECDNAKAHAHKAQKAKDRIKDRYLRRGGWRVVRLKERDIIERLQWCAHRIYTLAKTLHYGNSP